MTKEILAQKLINIKKQSFELYINDSINLSFFYDKQDNTINISNIFHYSSADYYIFNIDNINKIVNKTFENNYELNK